MTNLRLKPGFLMTAICSLCVLNSGLVSAEEDIDLASFDLEDLMSMELTSVSKKAERAFEAPAAAYVITSKVADVFGDSVDAYPKVDLRTAWNATENVTLDVTVENLVDGEHKEWNSEPFISGTKIHRIFYGKVTLDF
jgi:outer membrane receptor for ferrienterochelin and colicin